MKAKAVVGLVGGMGSGKSLVAAAFAEQGARIISADLFGHEALAQPDILARITQRWGDRVLDGTGQVDRRKMAGVVFASAVERTNLEMLVFPWIEGRIRQETTDAQNDSTAELIVLDAAIMLESGWHDVCDRIVYIHAPRAARLERLQKQRGWTVDEISKRETAQLPLSIKAAKAEAAIDNAGDESATRARVVELARLWQS